MDLASFYAQSVGKSAQWEARKVQIAADSERKYKRYQAMYATMRVAVPALFVITGLLAAASIKVIVDKPDRAGKK